MASSMRRLLQLPPSLRRAGFIAEQIPRASTSGRPLFQHLQCLQLRSFWSTKPLGQKSSSKSPPTNFPSAPLTTASSTRIRPPPAFSDPPRATSPAQNIGSLDAETVLLYTAPNHGGFFAYSYVTGLILVGGAYFTAENSLKDHPDRPKVSYYAKAANMPLALFMVIMGTACIIAPLRTIKSMAIVTAEGKRLFRFEIKRPLPLLKPNVLDAKLSEVLINQNIRSATGNFKLNNIPNKQAESFTADYLLRSSQVSPNRGVLSALSSFNKSLLHLWPSLKKNVRRMLVRDGMVYVSIGQRGYFKMDLQECSLLDSGRPLAKLVTIESKGRPSIGNWFRLFTGK